MPRPDPLKAHSGYVGSMHADATKELFSQLMGDEVEPRKNFIQDNALNVANLDF